MSSFYEDDVDDVGTRAWQRRRRQETEDATEVTRENDQPFYKDENLPEGHRRYEGFEYREAPREIDRERKDSERAREEDIRYSDCDGLAGGRRMDEREQTGYHRRRRSLSRRPREDHFRSRYEIDDPYPRVRERTIHRDRRSSSSSDDSRNPSIPPDFRYVKRSHISSSSSDSSPPRRRKWDRYEERGSRGRRLSSQRSTSRSIYRDSEDEGTYDRLPKNGKTRVPARLIDRLALIDLGYPFDEEDGVFIIQKALRNEDIEELIRLSESYGFENGQGFVPPLGIDGLPLRFEVPLLSHLDDDKAWKNTAVNLGVRRWDTILLDQARAYTGEGNGEKAILTLSDAARESTDGATLRWIHLKDEHMSIESLKGLIKLAPDLDKDDILIALKLLREVTEKGERSYIKGHYLKPTVLRGDGQIQGQSDRNCTFVSFSYFSLQTPPSTSARGNTHLHTAPGLLQTLYLLESTKARDEEQVICKIRPDKSYQSSIHVPQLWSIVLGSDVLITYATHDMALIQSSSIKVQRQLPKMGPSNLRVTDPYQRTFFFPIERCKTWFVGTESPSLSSRLPPVILGNHLAWTPHPLSRIQELEEIIYTQCELDSSYSPFKSQYAICSSDNTQIDGTIWPEILSLEESSFVDIVIQLKTYESEDSEESDFIIREHSRMRRNSRRYLGRRESLRRTRSHRATLRRRPSPVHIRQRSTRQSTERDDTKDPFARKNTTELRDPTQLYPKSRSAVEPTAEGSDRMRSRPQERGLSSHGQEQTLSTATQVRGVNRLTSISEGPDQKSVPAESETGGSSAKPHEEPPSAALDDVQGPKVPESDMKHIESSKISFSNEGLVAEPESYTTKPTKADHLLPNRRFTREESLTYTRRKHSSLLASERQRQSNTPEYNMALVPYERRQSSLAPEYSMAMATIPYNRSDSFEVYEDSPATREKSRPYSFTHRSPPMIRRNKSSYNDLDIRTHRHSRRENHEPSRRRYIDSFRALPLSPRPVPYSTPHQAYGYLHLPPSPPVPYPAPPQAYGYRDISSPLPAPLYPEKSNGDNHISAPYHQSPAIEDSRSASRATCRPSRSARALPTPSGIVTNAVRNTDLATDMYFDVKKTGDTVFNDENLKISIDGKGRNGAGDQYSKPGDHNTVPGSFEPSRASPGKASDERRYSASHKRSTPVGKAVKSSVLPILMWPAGPPTNSRISNNGDNHSDSLFDKKFGSGPPRIAANAAQLGNNDQSMQEVLERVYDSMLTEKSNSHDRLFHQMETAHSKDAAYVLPGLQKPAEANQQGEPSTLRDISVVVEAKFGSMPKIPTTTRNRASITGPKVPDYQTKLHQFSSTANELLEFFIPVDYSNPIIGRFYGSIKRIIEAIERFQKHNEISQQYKIQGAVFVIEDIGGDLEKHHLRPVSKPLEECSKCKVRFSYKNDVDAASHLVSDHFEADRVPKAPEVKLWIKRYHPLCDKRRSEEHFKVLKSCCNHLSVIHRGIEEIRDGVRTAGSTHNQRYRLPKALVESFRKLVMLLVYTSYVLDLITEHSESWTSLDWRLRDDTDVIDEIFHLQTLGYSVEEAIDQGKLDLMVMIRTQDYTESIGRHEAVGPHYILAMVLRNLQCGVNCNDLIDVYKEYIDRLSFQVSQFPRRRLLRDLRNVNEEIKSIRRNRISQWGIYASYLRVLHPQSFRITTEARISLYDLEQSLIHQGQEKLDRELFEYEQLMDHVERLMEATKHSVEINDDDHGKAILVFTIVTLVFLPLSFVTSFLGMNTIDIRNQNSTQSLFWVVALPITAVVVIVALVIGYKYDTMREWADKNFGKLKKE